MKHNNKPKILIVDDTPANLIALNAILKKLDAEVIRAHSGNDALSLVLEHDFALFLLDVQMPEMDGYELAAILTDEESTQDIPIIFLTAALKGEVQRAKGYVHGAIDFIEKPIDPNILLAKVGILLKIWKKNNELQSAFLEIELKNKQLEKEITLRKAMELKLDKLAMYDALTDLPNRVLLKKECNKAIEAAKRYDHQVGLMFLDLDGFKAVNDDYGHEYGDAVLVETAQRLKEAVRNIDIVARFGGDEFIIILPDCSSEKDATIIAQRIVTSINQHFMIEQKTITIGVSLGIAMYRTHAHSCDELINCADKAMYTAKESGKNQFRMHQSP